MICDFPPRLAPVVCTICRGGRRCETHTTRPRITASKIDTRDAYRIVPVHPDDYHLLGIKWKGATYVDRALPFGLRSAPTDVIAWVLSCQGIQYQLDDFLFIGAPNSQQGREYLLRTLEILAQLGILVAAHKHKARQGRSQGGAKGAALAPPPFFSCRAPPINNTANCTEHQSGSQTTNL